MKSKNATNDIISASMLRTEITYFSLRQILRD